MDALGKALLRKWRKDFDEDIEEIERQFKSDSKLATTFGSPRLLLLSVGANLDHYTARWLQTFLTGKRPALDRDSLFRQRGALNALGSKVEVLAYSGLISHSFKVLLNKVASLRNSAAHAAHYDFANKDKRVDELFSAVGLQKCPSEAKFQILAMLLDDVVLTIKYRAMHQEVLEVSDEPLDVAALQSLPILRDGIRRLKSA